MPVYTIRDTQTGRTMKVRGDHYPTQEEAAALFGQQGPKPIAETTNPEDAYNNSLMDTASKTVSGIGQGVLGALNPMTYIRPLQHIMYPAIYPLSANDVLGGIKNAAEMGQRVVSGDPEAGGQAIGALATGLVAPRLITGAKTGASAAASMATNPDAVGIISPRAGNILRTAQKVRDAAMKAKPPAPVEAPPTAAAGPPETPPAAPPPAAPSTPPSGPAPSGSLTNLRGALTDEEVQAVEGLVKQGFDRDQVLQQLEVLKHQAPPSKNIRLTAPETKVFLDLQRRGKSPQEAMAIIQQQRELTDRLGLSSPTVAQTKFPKGMRGGKAPLKPLE